MAGGQAGVGTPVRAPGRPRVSVVLKDADIRPGAWTRRALNRQGRGGWSSLHGGLTPAGQDTAGQARKQGL